MVRTLHFHCRGHARVPSLVGALRSHMAWPKKRKKERKIKSIYQGPSCRPGTVPGARDTVNKTGRQVPCCLRACIQFADKQTAQKGGQDPPPLVSTSARGWDFFFFNIYLFIYLAAPGLSCSTRDLRCSIQALSCDMRDLVPRPGIEPRPPALGVQILNHWTTREVLRLGFKPRFM